jgi:cellulose synthase/poly-beta-1,6-N-acetylglucosamine synthase-like glycosyltransferase
MQVLKKGLQCINEPNAIVLEDVSNDLKEEFRRKVRISAGNFQNLFSFISLLFRFDGASFAFFSHKVLRWKIPFILILILVLLPFINEVHLIYFYISILVFTLSVVVILDLILKKIQVNIAPFRFLTHFTAMNIALLFGFFKFLKGVKSSVWEPTKRMQ